MQKKKEFVGRWESMIGALTHEGDEAFLFEMPVGRQSLADPALSHHHH